MTPMQQGSQTHFHCLGIEMPQGENIIVIGGWLFDLKYDNLRFYSAFEFDGALQRTGQAGRRTRPLHCVSSPSRYPVPITR